MSKHAILNIVHLCELHKNLKVRELDMTPTKLNPQRHKLETCHVIHCVSLGIYGVVQFLEGEMKEETNP